MAVYKLNESLFDDLTDPVFKDRYNDGLNWYRITYEYSPEYGNSYDRETWVRAKNIKDAEQKFFEKHNDDCYISEIMDKETALGIDYEMESINEGNPVSHELPSSIDLFLQDVAQTTGQISYNDIAKFAMSKFTSEDLKALRKLRREYFDPEIDPWDDDTFSEIGKKVAVIVKGTRSKENSSLREYVEEGNKVLQVTFDVEVPKNVNLNVQAMSGNTEFYKKLSEFLSSLGYEMAGDIIDTIDITNMYK